MLKKLILLTLLSTAIWAQKPVPDADRISYSHQYTFLNQRGYNFIDTSLSSLKWYRELNNAHRDNFGQLSLGNLGAARNNLLIPNFKDFWSWQDQGPYQDYFHRPNQVPFYHVRSPLTEARYLQGYDRGQVFRILHSQNINKRWNATLQYKRLNSLGFYENQQHKQANFLFSTAYKSKNEFYQARAYVLSEKMEIQENGGIVTDSAFTENLQATRVLINTNLENDNRLLFHRDIWVDQKLDFLKLFQKKEKRTILDSLQQPDSLAPVMAPAEKAQSKFIFGHRFRYQRQAQVYEGRTNSYYANYYYDRDGQYRDSMAVATYTNKVYLETEIGDTSSFKLHGGVVHQYVNYHNRDRFDLNHQQLGLDGNLAGNYQDYLVLRAQASYLLRGPFANNFDLQGYAEGKVYKSLRGFAEYKIQNKHPNLYQQVYYGNNFAWNQDFSAVLSNELCFGLRWQNENYLRARTFTANNFVYFNANAVPEVAPEVVAYQSIDLKQNFDLWSFLHLDNTISYQLALSGAEFLPLPELVNRHSLYFHFELFDGALKVLTGVEGAYFSSYNSPTYSAATGRFYLANEYPIGNYWLVDAFAHFKVAKAIFFLKMENLSEGFVPYNYWAAPHVPLNDRILRIGINWRFFN